VKKTTKTTKQTRGSVKGSVRGANTRERKGVHGKQGGVVVKSETAEGRQKTTKLRVIARGSYKQRQA